MANKSSSASTSAVTKAPKPPRLLDLISTLSLTVALLDLSQFKRFLYFCGVSVSVVVVVVGDDAHRREPNSPLGDDENKRKDVETAGIRSISLRGFQMRCPKTRGSQLLMFPLLATRSCLVKHPANVHHAHCQSMASTSDFRGFIQG